MADGSTPAPDDDPFPRPLQNWRDDGEGRRAAPDAVWAAVREDYLAGLSATEACRRHGVGLRALRERAAREGWRRIDQPWAPRNRLDPDDEGVELEARVGGDLDKVGPRDLSWVAGRRMMRAILRGDAVEALRWRKVREALEAEEAELERLAAQQDAIWASWREHREAYGPGDPPEDAADEPHAVHSVHSVHCVSEPAPDPVSGPLHPGAATGQGGPCPTPSPASPPPTSPSCPASPRATTATGSPPTAPSTTTGSSPPSGP